MLVFILGLIGCLIFSTIMTLLFNIKNVRMYFLQYEVDKAMADFRKQRALNDLKALRKEPQ